MEANKISYACVTSQKMYPYLENPAFVSLGGGLPHPSSFPILKASFELPTPPNYDGTPYVSSSSSSSGTSNGHANGHSNGRAAKHDHAHGHGHGAKEPEVPGKTTMKMYKGPQVGGAHAALDLAQAQQCKFRFAFQIGICNRHYVHEVN